jgi:hypothetical protein
MWLPVDGPLKINHDSVTNVEQRVAKSNVRTVPIPPVWLFIGQQHEPKL